MLTCHRCMKRCLQTLIGDSEPAYTPPLAACSINHPRKSYGRTLYTTSRAKSDSDLLERRKRTTSISKSNLHIKKGADSTSFNRQKWLESRGVTPLHKRKEEQTDDTLVRNQLRHLKDPLKLAEHIRKTLREDGFEDALAIVRAASKNTQCVVSWNHLIDWQLSQGKMNGALKTYNEMKKRAQTPDAHTFTIIFRGCAEHPLHAQALGKVISVYNSMLNDKSPVKPNTIHMNAVLNMCSKANDMDALSSIAAQLPAKGIRAPNNLTFSIILNATRMHALESLRGGLTEVQKRKVRQKANMDARLIWEEITQRWRQGDILVDEALVCTMGRVLLLGEEQDIDDILSLIEQTMNIPRQAPPLYARKGRRERGREEETVAGEQSTNDFSTGDESPATSEELNLAVVNPFKTPAPANKGTYLYAKPGQNTLALLMSALLDLQLKAPAAQYWNIITTDHDVKPDADNYHGYLRILRNARASTESVKLLLTMPPSYMEAKTFRISMSTCIRDKNNHHAFSNAGKILDLMQESLAVPDVQALSNYLEVAFSCTTPLVKPSARDPSPAQYQQGRQIMRALERINVSYLNLRSLLAHGDPSKPGATHMEKTALTEKVLRMTQKLVAAHDMLMRNALVEKHLFADLRKERSKLAAFITRFKEHKETSPRPALSLTDTEDGKIRKAERSRFNRHLGRVRVTDPPLKRRKALARKAGVQTPADPLGNCQSGSADGVGAEWRRRAAEA